MTTTMKCPICHKPVVYSLDNPFRPFCSERCKLIDLGEWAKEERRIAGEKVDVEQDELLHKEH